jgi:hypothetical protein
VLCIKWLSNLTAQVPIFESILPGAAAVPKDLVWYTNLEISTCHRKIAYVKSGSFASHAKLGSQRSVK